MQDRIHSGFPLYGNHRVYPGRRRRDHPQNMSVHNWRSLVRVHLLDGNYLRSRHRNAGIIIVTIHNYKIY